MRKANCDDLKRKSACDKTLDSTMTVDLLSGTKLDLHRKENKATRKKSPHSGVN